MLESLQKTHAKITVTGADFGGEKIGLGVRRRRASI
jgi:hypothetical protein